MADVEHSPVPLTYDTATPEQVAEARANARRKLADARAKHGPEYRAALRERLQTLRQA